MGLNPNAMNHSEQRAVKVRTCFPLLPRVGTPDGCYLLTSSETKHRIVFPGPKMVAVRNYHGTPAPIGKAALSFQTGEFIELLKGDPDTTWWEVKHPTSSI